MTTVENPYKYKYNGVEYQDELDLNLYSMDMRQYDPAIGRWTGIDPITNHSMSTYNGFNNNPVFWADPSGASVTDGNGESYVTEDGTYRTHEQRSAAAKGKGGTENGTYIVGVQRTLAQYVDYDRDGKKEQKIVTVLHSKVKYLTTAINGQSLTSIVTRTDIYETILDNENQIESSKHTFNKSIVLKNMESIQNTLVYPEVVDSETIALQSNLVTDVLNSIKINREPVIDTALREFNNVQNYSPGFVPNKVGEIIDRLNPALVIPGYYLDKANSKPKRELRVQFKYKKENLKFFQKAKGNIYD